MQLESPVPRGEIASKQLAGGSTMVYLGNGCFWARQYALVRVEQHSPAFRYIMYVCRVYVCMCASVFGGGGGCVYVSICLRLCVCVCICVYI